VLVTRSLPKRPNDAGATAGLHHRGPRHPRARHSRTAPASHLSGVRQRSLRWRCCRA